MLVLGIETSCDETAAAVVRGDGESVEVLANVVSSQIDIHRRTGGVVPEVAAREHVVNILPVIDAALKKAGVSIFPDQALFSSPSSRLPSPCQGEGEGEVEVRGLKLDTIAVTTGPGLITSLMVGVETAKSLAAVWNIPVVAVNHIEGHIAANYIGGNPKSEIRNPKPIEYPAVVLTVSGGHTILAIVKEKDDLQIIGETRDDAAGEAFDKASAMLGLGYPGGPAVAAAAAKSEIRNPKSEIDIHLPRPMLDSGDHDFSFSGLKTALLYQLRDDKDWRERVPEYACEFQEAVVDTLVGKALKAAKKFSAKTIMLTGGVAANTRLRQVLAERVTAELPGVELVIPELSYTTDNAAMVASAGYFKALRQEYTTWPDLKADCNQGFK